MLGHCLRRWPSIKATLAGCLMFAGNCDPRSAPCEGLKNTSNNTLKGLPSVPQILLGIKEAWLRITKYSRGNSSWTSFFLHKKSKGCLSMQNIAHEVTLKSGQFSAWTIYIYMRSTAGIYVLSCHHVVHFNAKSCLKIELQFFRTH